MKKNSKLKSLFGFFLILLLIGGYLVAHVALKKKCDDLIKQRIEFEGEIKKADNKMNLLHAKYQNLTSEEYIIPFAIENLGMTGADPPVHKITIEKEKIADLQTLLEEQYD